MRAGFVVFEALASSTRPHCAVHDLRGFFVGFPEICSVCFFLHEAGADLTFPLTLSLNPQSGWLLSYALADRFVQLQKPFR